MKHFNSVIAFGDSHVAGCELSSQYSIDDIWSKNIEELDKPGKELAFPKIIADRLEVPCYNYAMSGGSNERSLRLLTEAVQEHPNSLVLFGYTISDRREFYYPDSGTVIGRDKDNFVQCGFQWDLLKTKNPVNDCYLEILRPYNNLKQLMFIVDNICTMWATDFLHLPLFPESVPDVDNLFTFEGHGNYLDWCASKNFKRHKYLHYGQDAHNALAELILKDL